MEYGNFPAKDAFSTTRQQLFFGRNSENLAFLKATLKEICSQVNNSIINIENVLVTKQNLEKSLKNIDPEIEKIYIDISGMANFLIILMLNEIKKTFCNKPIVVVYSEAEEYYPLKDDTPEILRVAKSRSEDDILKMSELLGASGARETFILPDFKGYFREDLPTCLIFFVGYEPSRAIGLLEGYRPNRVVACYGVSPHERFKWRTGFSEELHKNLNVFKEYDKFKTEISTFEVSSIISKLEEIYSSKDRNGDILYENYNIAITPQCSKLQTVATYLFCLSHPDIQVVFCLPGAFNPGRYSKGIGKKWLYELPF